MNDNPFILHPAKAHEIASVVNREYKAGKGAFKDYKEHDYQVPQGMIEGSKEHSLYVTYIFALDQDTRTNELWRQSRHFYEETPWFFDAEHILTRSDEGLSKALTKLGISDTSTSLRKWRAISKVLLECYNGDARRINDKSPDLVMLRRRVGELLGCTDDRQINRYLQLMAASRLLKITKPESLALFGDEHIAVFSICTGVLKFEGEIFEGALDADPIASLTRKAWIDAAASIDVPPLALEDAISVVSRRLCPERKCIVCPIYQKCEKRFRLEIDGGKIRLIAVRSERTNAMRFCTYCGRELMRRSRFCDNCGMDLLRE